ncbi:hypothetical protein [uncultured Serinicoccus sp.]|uniref:hypothetical protein n=1 Tax=uncultured Serinicoccus sp. TaxID=735514 RepID=UPI002636079D|nr:hypothetical protein [uncultured Serinicoccus sp.]
MVPDFPGWIVVVLWVLLGIAGLAIVWASTRNTLKGMDMVLGPPEGEENQRGKDRLRGEGRRPDGGGNVEGDHDRGAPER